MSGFADALPAGNTQSKTPTKRENNVDRLPVEFTLNFCSFISIVKVAGDRLDELRKSELC